jgi:hypothetical protein
LCKKLREDTQRLEEGKVTLEEMVESRDELLMEIARETGVDHILEDDEDEAEDEHADDGEDDTAPLAATRPPPAPPMDIIPEQEAPMAHEVILADAKPEMPQPHLYHALMRDYEESPPRMMEDLDDLHDDPNEGRSDMDEWFSKDGSNDRD